MNFSRNALAAVNCEIEWQIMQLKKMLLSLHWASISYHLSLVRHTETNTKTGVAVMGKARAPLTFRK